MRCGRLLMGLIGLTIWGTSTGSAAATPGDLDTSFGNGGTSTVNLGGSLGAGSVVLQPDGKILASTTLTGFGNEDIGVARLNSQGDLDRTYGSGYGFSRLDFGNDDGAGELVLQPDGKIDVVGSAFLMGAQHVFVVARLLNPEGALDGSFANGQGYLTSKFSTLSPSGALDEGSAIALQPDNGIVVGGWSDLSTPGDLNFAVARVLNPEGTLDNSFGGGDGGTEANFGPGTDQAFDVAVQPDGKIVLAGQRGGGPGDAGTAVARFLPDGTPDPSFSFDGKVVSTGGFESSMALQPDGKIVLTGTAFPNLSVVRLKSDGSPDNSFGGDGRTAVDFGAQNLAGGLALQPDGKILVGGFTGKLADGGPATGDFAIARLQPNGLLDSTFGNNGEARVDIGTFDYGYAVALQGDGKIVLGGFSGPTETVGDIAFARLQGDPGGAKKAKCASKQATIIGTSGKDKLKGTRRKT